MLENHDLMATIATFVLNCVEKVLDRVKREGTLAGIKRLIREQPPSLPTSDPSDGDDILSEKKKNRRVRYDKKNRKKLSLLSSSDKILYCRACLKSTHYHLEFLYVTKPSDLLLTRENNSKKWGCLSWSEQVRSRRGRGTVRGGSGCDRLRFVRGDAQALETPLSSLAQQ